MLMPSLFDFFARSLAKPEFGKREIYVTTVSYFFMSASTTFISAGNHGTE